MDRNIIHLFFLAKTGILLVFVLGKRIIVETGCQSTLQHIFWLKYTTVWFKVDVLSTNLPSDLP